MEQWHSACLSSGSQSERPLVQLYVDPAGFSRRFTGLSLPLRVVTSSTGFPSKRCPGIRFLSIADQEIEVFLHVAPATTLRLEIPRETRLILRSTKKVGNPFQTMQGNRPSCHDQVGRRGSDEVVPETWCYPRVKLVCRGTFGVTSRVPNTVCHFKTECVTSLETL